MPASEESGTYQGENWARISTIEPKVVANGVAGTEIIASAVYDPNTSRTGLLSPLALRFLDRQVPKGSRRLRYAIRMFLITKALTTADRSE